MGWIRWLEWEFEVPSIWFVSEPNEGIHPMFLPPSGKNMAWIPSLDWEFEMHSIWFVSESSEGIHPMFLPEH